MPDRLGWPDPMTPDELLLAIDFDAVLMFDAISRICERSCWLMQAESGADPDTRDRAGIVLSSAAAFRTILHYITAPLAEDINAAHAPRDHPCPLAELRAKVESVYDVLDCAG